MRGSTGDSSRAIFRYLTHPQVGIDPDVPVPKWGLSELGKRRAEVLCKSPSLRKTRRIVSSTEVKAIETASILATGLGIEFEARADMHENDRSATGFLDSSEFEATADLFFAKPDKSVRGWVRAIDAQSRIVREVEAVLARYGDADLLFVGHGAVGTLLYCHYSRLPIDRIYDQAPGGGNFFSVSLDQFAVLRPWRPMEEM